MSIFDYIIFIKKVFQKKFFFDRTGFFDNDWYFGSIIILLGKSFLQKKFGIFYKSVTCSCVAKGGGG